MPWFALLGAVLVVAVTVLVRARRRKAAGRPAWGEVIADSDGLLELLGHIDQVDDTVVCLGQAIDAVVPERGPAVTAAEPGEVARAYAAAGDALVELSREKLGREPSIVVARFIRLSRDGADDLDELAATGTDLLSWLDAVGDALRSDRVLLPVTTPPGLQDLGGVVHELRRAVTAQIDALAPLFAPSRPHSARLVVTRSEQAALENRTAEARRRLRAADALAARGEVRAALVTLAGIALPSLPDGPSTGFAMAGRAAVARLRRVAAGYDTAVAGLVGHASGLVDYHVEALVDVVTAAATEHGRLRHADMRPAPVAPDPDRPADVDRVPVAAGEDRHAPLS